MIFQCSGRGRIVIFSRILTALNINFTASDNPPACHTFIYQLKLTISDFSENLSSKLLSILERNIKDYEKSWNIGRA